MAMLLILLSLLLVLVQHVSCYKSLRPRYITSSSALQSSSSSSSSLMNKNIVSLIASIGLMLPLAPQPSLAFGPQDVDLKIVSYKQVELCDGKKPIMPGQKAAEGLFPVCIEVDADVVNNGKNELKDVSVYGFIKEDAAGNSVLVNNPDFRSDAGQYAMIKSVPVGSNRVKFQFVAAFVQDPKKEALPSLTFFKTKAISFPGGDKFKPLDECEIDPRASGCSGGIYDEE
jgi:hypothetical protein